MAYDLEEQEQIETLKSWWAQYGKLVIVAIVAGSLSFAGYNGWRYYSNQQRTAAATLYQQLVEAERGNEHKRARDIAARIVDAHGSTMYALMAALASARSAFVTGDLPAAKKDLQWVLDRAKDDEMRDLARLRLAGVLLDEKNHAEALKVLDAKPTEAFTGRFADLRGDVLALQGKLVEARSNYQTALEKSDAQSQYRQMIQLKLDALGEAK